MKTNAYDLPAAKIQISNNTTMIKPIRPFHALTAAIAAGALIPGLHAAEPESGPATSTAHGNTAHRAERPSQPTQNQDSRLREIERKVLFKQYESSITELAVARKAVLFASTPEQAATAKLLRQNHSAWCMELEHRLARLDGEKTAIGRKLDAILIPVISFEECTLKEAIDFLRLRSIELDNEPDPTQKGVNFVFRSAKAADNASDPRKAVTNLNLRNVSLRQALDAICTNTGLVVYSLNGFAVIIELRNSKK